MLYSKPRMRGSFDRFVFISWCGRSWSLDRIVILSTATLMSLFGPPPVIQRGSARICSYRCPLRFSEDSSQSECRDTRGCEVLVWVTGSLIFKTALLLRSTCSWYRPGRPRVAEITLIPWEYTADLSTARNASSEGGTLYMYIPFLYCHNCTLDGLPSRWRAW